MPLYERQCMQGHRQEEYAHSAAHLGSRTILCHCGHTMGRVMSVGQGLCWFEEGRTRWLEHLAPHPVPCRSHAEHQRLMKKYGVEWATQGRGRPGQWV